MSLYVNASNEKYNNYEKFILSLLREEKNGLFDEYPERRIKLIERKIDEDESRRIN